MRKFAAIAGAAALGLGLQSAAHAYSVSAAVTFTFGGSNNSAGADQGHIANAGPIPIGGVQPTNATVFHLLTDATSTSTFNSDYATTTDCAPGGVYVPSGMVRSTRKYGCRYGTSAPNLFRGLFTTDTNADTIPDSGHPDPGPVGQASGTITVTDTTLTGTLTIVNTSDEPTGATTTFVVGTTGVPGTTRVSNSVGNGFAGYNYRQADGSPFGNSWLGVTTAGTYTLNLTGTFTNASWNVDGGYASFTDPGFACAQGGTGGDVRGTLCTHAVVGGGFEDDGGGLSWGMDPDATGTAGVGAITMKNFDGSVTLATLSGVIANMSIAANGAITTNSGDTRRGLAQSNAGCVDHIRYDENTNLLSCGSVISGALVVTGNVADTDSDGINDGLDNCTLVSNATQIDSNGDGYGNICDADINNSGLTTATDFNLLRGCLNQLGYPTGTATCQASDMNATGTVTATDFNLLRTRINTAPGPSGLH